MRGRFRGRDIVSRTICCVGALVAISACIEEIFGGQGKGDRDTDVG